MFFNRFILLLLVFGSSICYANFIFNQNYEESFSKAEEILKKQKLSKESTLCLRSLPQNTRFFLYRRYVEQIRERSSYSSLDKLIQKYGRMSYLACRESSGLGVALSAHGSEAQVSYYGRFYSALKNGIQQMIAKRFKYKRKSYFSITTNVGLFQVSLDQVDSRADKYDPELEIHFYFLEQVKALSAMGDKSLLHSCGTEEFFDLKKEPELLKELRESLKLMKYSSELQHLSLYIKLQTLCPVLNFELAKKIYDLKGGHYFGPLNNKRNSRSCGTSFSLCAPIFRNIYSLLF
jgi:hypothetical protein